MHYLFGFSGRINRALVWAFILVGIVWEIVTITVAAVGLRWDGFSESMFVASHKGVINWGAVAWPPLDTTQSKVALAIIVLLVVLFVWASFAVMVKRLHDRNKSAWWLVPYVLLPNVIVWGMNFAPENILSMPLVAKSGFVVMTGIFLLNMWVFIELYCLRGTRGDNRFGPDPLA